LFQKYAEQADNKRSFELGKPQKKFSALGIGNTLPNLRKIIAAFGNELPRVLGLPEQATEKRALK
jgi:hypothetical protein